MGVGDDLSGCVAGANATLTFHYANDAGHDVFAQYIGSVDAFVFDARNRLVAHGRFERASLDAFRGWKLNLPAGDYRAVCWANAGRNSVYSPLTPGETTFESCTVSIDPSSAATGDKVFYAPRKTHLHAASRGAGADGADYAFTVPAAGSVVKPMWFVRAHRTLNVYVQGFSDGGQPPVIEVSNLWGSYDFLFNTLAHKRDFAQTAHAVTTLDGPATMASFDHAFGEIPHDLVITIRKASDNSVVWEVNLRAFLDLNPDALKNDIDVLIAFNDLGVTVSVPGWSDKPISPGI